MPFSFHDEASQPYYPSYGTSSRFSDNPPAAVESLAIHVRHDETSGDRSPKSRLTRLNSYLIGHVYSSLTRM